MNTPSYMPPFVDPTRPFGQYYSDPLQFLNVHNLNRVMNDENIKGFQRDRGTKGKTTAGLRSRVRALGGKEEFDPRIFTPRIVSQRDDGTYFTIDGHGSNEWVEELFGPDTRVPCVVLTGLTLAEEADLFEKAQRGKPVTKALQFMAAVEAERPRATEIKEIMDSVGGEIGSGRSRKEGAENHKFGQSALTYIYDAHGAQHLQLVVKFIRRYFWNDPQSGNVGFVRALGDLLNTKGYEADKLASALTGTSVADLLQGLSGGGAISGCLREMKERYHRMWGKPDVSSETA